MPSFIASIGFTHPWFPTWHGGPHLNTIALEAENPGAAQAAADAEAAKIAGVLGTPCVEWVKTKARHHHDKVQAAAACVTKPRRVIPRGDRDLLEGDQITLRFKRGLVRTMSINGWLTLLARCSQDVHGARSIVKQVATGCIEDHLPA